MDLTALLKSFPVNRWVIWAGAGVSYPGPSSLPLGIPLTQFALEECCGEDIRVRIEGMWGRANGIIAGGSGAAPLGSVPRLESVLGDIDDVRAKSSGCEFDFLRGFEAFADAPFNENHLHIADLLRQGATVVTTNFDTCIEAAYKSLARGEGGPPLEREPGGSPHRLRRPGHPGELWHIHGTAEDVPALGATLRAVKEGLTEALEGWLDEVFADGRLLIFLGYSASDSFDVNLYFSNRPEAHFGTSAAVFLQHTGPAPPPNAALLLRPFGRRHVLTDDTTRALKTLAGDRHRPAAGPRFPWRERFLAGAVTADREKVRDFLVCKLAFTLGVNVELLNEGAYARALRTESLFDELDFHKTMAYVCRVQGRAELEKQHDVKVKRGDEDLLGYYYSRGDFKKALLYAKPLDGLFADASGPGAELDWRTYTSMSAHCRPLVMKYFANPFAGGVAAADRPRIKKLLDLTELLGKVPLREVRFINQIATARRFNFLFRALLDGVNDEAAVEQVLSLYGEVASVAGFVGTYRDAAIKDFFLTRHHRAGRAEEARSYAQKSLSLASLIGDLPSVKRAKKLRLYLSLYAALAGRRRPR